MELERLPKYPGVGPGFGSARHAGSAVQAERPMGQPQAHPNLLVYEVSCAFGLDFPSQGRDAQQALPRYAHCAVDRRLLKCHVHVSRSQSPG